MKFLLFLLIFFETVTATFAQENSIQRQIDSLMAAKTTKPFNGVILIAQDGQIKCAKSHGFSNIDKKELLKLDQQFVIGSVSKQFTAVLVLREVDKGTLDLFTPIHKYLPELSQKWADTVTVYHLLTHMHGITNLNKPTTFKAGTQYSYSQIGYDLLAKIVEKTSKKSFAALSENLFSKYGLQSTFHPDIKNYRSLATGYTENENGAIEIENDTFENYVAAGTFISTASDLLKWNEMFYGGKLLKSSTMTRLKTKQKGAVRDHPLFGITEYGYGITVDTKENILQYGQTGFTPGFVSMNFYFPKTKASVIVLENIVYDPNDLVKAFRHHIEILKIVRNEIKNFH